MNQSFGMYKPVTLPTLRIKSHCIPFTSCAVYKELPVSSWDGTVWVGTQCPKTNLEVRSGTVSVGVRKLWVYEEQGDVIAEWLPRQTGMYIQGRGQTVLEAVGDLCIWDGVVEIAEPCEVVERRWSMGQAIS